MRGERTTGHPHKQLSPSDSPPTTRGFFGQIPIYTKEFPRLTPTKAELLLIAQQLKGLERPSNRDYESVLNFMENDGGQLFEEDMGFVYEKEDLVTLRPGREYAWLDGLLERALKVLRCRLIRVS